MKALFVFILFGTGLNAFSQFVTENHYGGAQDEQLFDVIKTSTGYDLFGWTQSDGNGSADFYFVNTDLNGNETNSHTYGGLDSESGLAMLKLTDGYLLAGTTRTYGAGNGDFWVVKVDNAGTTIWNETYGGGADDYLRAVAQYPDGSFILSGFTASYGVGGKDMYTVKIDANGNLLWDQTIGGTGDEEGWDVIINPDNSVMVFGWTQSFGSGQADFYLTKLNTAGDIVWSEQYGGSLSDSGLSIKPNSSGYLLLGTTRSSGAGAGDVWLIQVDQNGTLVWDETYGGTNEDYGRYLCVTATNYYICGYSESFSNGGKDVYIVKTDLNGNQLYADNFGGTLDEESWKIRVVDNEIIVVGFAKSSGLTNGGSDGYMIRLDETVSTEKITLNQPELKAWPNPSTGKFTIDTQGQKIIRYNITDINGKEINAPLYGNELLLTDQATGIYYIQITLENGEKGIVTLSVTQ